MLLKRASPMPPAAYFFAKLAMAMIFGALIIAGLFVLGATLADVQLPPARWLALGGVLVAGAVPFCAMGLVLGTFAGPNSAPALVNLIYLPMGFASGLWIPVQFLPKIFQQIALVLPGYHYGQLALGTLDASSGSSAGGHLLYLVVFTLLCLAAAAIGLRRSEDKTYG
jgi:ABC-2 type transport system permease protein